MTRSSCSTWVRSPSSGRTGEALATAPQPGGLGPTDSITRKLYALIARCHQMLGDLPGALAVCAEGLTFDPEDAELLFREAVVRGRRARLRRPSPAGDGSLTLRRPEQFASVDQGIYGHLTLRNLAALAAERGDRVEAKRLWKSVLARMPRRCGSHREARRLIAVRAKSYEAKKEGKRRQTPRLSDLVLTGPGIPTAYL